MRAKERVALAALGTILLISAVWWAMALWPTAQATPVWLERTRSVCFGTRADGLPDTYGWLVLTGQPLAMLVILFFAWGDDVLGGFRALARSHAGRVTLAFSALALVAGIGAVGARVQGATSAYAAPTDSAPADSAAARALAAVGAVTEPSASSGVSAVRLDREPPPLALIDQRGDAVALAELEGRVVLVTFAFGHCEAVCPTVVRDVLAARRELAVRGTRAVAIVVTLDPWRDTPSRLAHIADRWEMGEGEHFLSGNVESVEATLDAWEVGRQRDLSTGDIGHPRLVYLVSAAGRLVGATGGSIAELVTSVGRQ
jgi:cytochrome oxidase Cu insertion factor (SCO1/SenC/PrrC family)